MKRLAVVILNYRRAALTIDCVKSLAPEMADHPDWHVVLIDNGSDDESGDVLEQAVRENNWDDWLTFVRSKDNTGFAGGNNIGFRTVEAEYYLLLNSDARVRHCAISTLLAEADAHPEAGLLGPELQDPDGTPQISCFRYRTPISEMLQAAGTGVIDSIFRNWVVAIPPEEAHQRLQWVSFACILIRRGVIEQIGDMDDGYFMYFEDIDFARRARKAGWQVRYVPKANVVHLRGGTSSVKSAIKERKRIPKYYYEARSRYFAKFYGGIFGLWFTNMLWLAGRTVSFVREVFGKKPSVCAHEFRDNWTRALHPMKESVAPGGGDL